MASVSPLRYPGGKAKLSGFVKALIAENDLLDGVYFEPYAGGASIGLELVFEEYVSCAHINDKNFAVYCLWREVLDDSAGLCSWIRQVPLTVDEWRRQRHILVNSRNYLPSEVGKAAFYLNRTNRSGIIRGGGIIGGVRQEGDWKMDARFHRERLCARIEKVARYRSRISVTNLDALDFLKLARERRHAKSFIYLDPPYYHKASRLYENFYVDKDHESVAAAVGEMCDKNWLISYDNAQFIRDLYKGFRQYFINLRYSASSSGWGSEVLVVPGHLKLPLNGDLKSTSVEWA